MKKLNRKNKSRLCYLLTIPFLTLTNIPNIIFSYDNDVWATRRKQSFNRQNQKLNSNRQNLNQNPLDISRKLTSDLFNAIKSNLRSVEQNFISLLSQLSILDENNFNNYSNPMTIANLFNNLSKKMKKMKLKEF